MLSWSACQLKIDENCQCSELKNMHFERWERFRTAMNLKRWATRLSLCMWDLLLAVVCIQNRTVDNEWVVVRCIIFTPMENLDEASDKWPCYTIWEWIWTTFKHFKKVRPHLKLLFLQSRWEFVFPPLLLGSVCLVLLRLGAAAAKPAILVSRLR